MKALLATAALVVAVSTASPASAQVYYADRSDNQALGAYAQAPLTAQQRRNVLRRPIMNLDGRIHSSNPAFDVYTMDRYVGSDPDPFIRNDLARNPPDRDD
jgi:hypothetical protein